MKETTPLALTRTRETSTPMLDVKEEKEAKRAKKLKKDKAEKKTKKLKKEKKVKKEKISKRLKTPSERSESESESEEEAETRDRKRRTETGSSGEEEEGDDNESVDDDDESESENDDARQNEPEGDVSEEFARARAAVRQALERFGNVECLDEELRQKHGKSEAVEKACKTLGMQIGALIKKTLRKNLSLMGARDNLLATSLSLEDDLRPRKSTDPLVDNMDPANFQCRMWDSIAKHDNVVFGRAQAAMDSVENRQSTSATTEGEVETAFAKVYRDAFIEAYGDDIETLRKDEKTNVSVILRAIQSGVDIVPELQKQLHLQWSTLSARQQPKESTE